MGGHDRFVLFEREPACTLILEHTVECTQFDFLGSFIAKESVHVLGSLGGELTDPTWDLGATSTVRDSVSRSGYEQGWMGFRQSTRQKTGQ